MNRRTSDEEQMSGGSSGTPLLAGLMIGGLLGASAMLLFAPQAGRQTRAALQEGAMDLKDRTTVNVRGAVSQAKSRAQQVASDVRVKAADLQNQGRNIAIDQLDRVASAAQAGKQTLQSSRSNNSES